MIDHCLQGGPAKHPTSLHIEGFNVVLKRDFLDLFLNDDAGPFLRDRLPNYRGVISVTFAEGIIAVQFTDHARLESCVKSLIFRGFDMTTDGRFADFAIVHGTHGFAILCDWLELQHEDGGATISLRSVHDHASILADVYNWDSMGPIADLGRGFMLSRDDDHDMWIDFDSGKTIVTLKDRATARLLLPN